jgi:NADH-quinone oxidoreductase subunit H
VIPEAIVGVLRGWWPNFPINGFELGTYIGNLFAAHVFVIKASLLVTLQIWVRWTLPRLRIDQVMTTCLKYLVPISCFLFLGAVFWPLILASTPLGRPVLFGPPVKSVASASSTSGHSESGSPTAVAKNSSGVIR